jgi:hypothetical protein
MVTDAPLVVRIGSAEDVFRLTAVSARPLQTVEATLRGDDVAVGSGESSGAEPGRPLVHKVVVSVRAADIDAWGPHTWSLYGRSGNPEDIGFSGGAPAEVRAHSLLGVAASRSGEVVSLRGSARAYHNVVDRYVPWSGQPVSVQRLIGTTWVQVSGARTDARGNVAVAVKAPVDSIFRLVIKDTVPTWGARTGWAVL